jgi:multiple sugar transport system permease protein
MFPLIALVTPLFTIERALGLFNTWPGLIIPYVAFGLPLGIYTLSAFFREIPWELEKAAKVDGASPFQAFVRVIAPLAAPGMVTTAILVFLACWNDFILAISFTSTISARTAVLQRRIGIHRPDGSDRGRRGGHHHPDRNLRAVLPAPDRGRADVRRG